MTFTYFSHLMFQRNQFAELQTDISDRKWKEVKAFLNDMRSFFIRIDILSKFRKRRSGVLDILEYSMEAIDMHARNMR